MNEQLERDWDTFCLLEREITGSEVVGIETRWRFGQMLLGYPKQERSKNSPLVAVVRALSSELGISEAELYNRRQFAEQYADCSNALEQFTSWHDIVAVGLGERGGERTPRELPPPPDLPVGEFSVVYCDPPWRYEHNQSPKSRAVELNYPTMELDAIKELKPPAADNSILFMWATSPKLSEALEVVSAWNFDYRTNMVWVKDRIGMGYYCRSQHELLLIAKRGNFPTPSESDLPPSVLNAPRGQHSEKPEEFYGVIERLYPGYERVELFARSTREGWQSWGNEI